MVFIYDNSGSMQANRAWVDPASQDTVFYFWTHNCQETTTSDFLAYATLTGPSTIRRLNSGAICTDFSGDPCQGRGQAVKEALDYLAARVP